MEAWKINVGIIGLMLIGIILCGIKQQMQINTLTGELRIHRAALVLHQDHIVNSQTNILDLQYCVSNIMECTSSILQTEERILDVEGQILWNIFTDESKKDLRKDLPLRPPEPLPPQPFTNGIPNNSNAPPKSIKSSPCSKFVFEHPFRSFICLL